jgi:hypothetical protein
MLKMLLVVVLASVAIAMMPLSPAFACACCSDRGQRVDIVQEIDDRIRSELESLRFSTEAKLALGARDDLEGVDHTGSNFTVSVAQDKDRIIFSLRDEKGRAGTLSLLNLRMISIFEVDTYDTPDSGLGPVLYKEWRITTAVAGDGIFRANVGANRRIMLVLHGRGLSCTEINHFSHWSLEVRKQDGDRTDHYTFHGELTSGSRQ